VLPHRFARVRACLYASPYEARRLRAIARARPRGESPRSCRAQGDASDRLPALRTTDSNARTRRLPARSLGVRRLFGAVVPVTLVPRLAPRAHPRDVAVARRPLARRRRAVHRAARGRSMPMRPGGSRFTTRSSLLLPPTCGARRVLPGARIGERRLASLSPPSRPRAEVAFAIDARSRRPPRPTPRWPRERLTLLSARDTFHRQVLRAPPAPESANDRSALFDHAALT